MPLNRSKDTTAVVYFLRSGERIKIGSTTNPRTRFGEIANQIGADVELLGWMPGDYEVEHNLHKRFLATRIEGEQEWYTPSPELDAVIAIACPAATCPPDSHKSAAVRLDHGTYEMLRRIGARRDRSISNLLLIAVDLWIAVGCPEPPESRAIAITAVHGQ
jgi:hypothetical protein